MRRILKCLTILAMFTGPAHANDVNLNSFIYQEVRSVDARTISATNSLRRGDRVVTLLDWRSREPETVTMTAAVPRDLSFLNASAEGVEISTDGGRSWHATDSNSAGRVTHLRWKATPGRGRLTYSAIVR
ncbi:hypothetical protein [Altererythrobacter sp. MF3-039]|uniref:hypothetical protein n=1 Tax=Altererythrobacter sp. MF3-039 TaxID=3252901 RepID=UPI00390CB071